MPERAQVMSVEAIEAFRASLIVYLARVRPLLEEVSSDLRRTQSWMETDQRLFWERETRRRARALENAQQALLSARIATFREVTVLEQAAVANARRALEEAEGKQVRLRRWTREFGPRTELLVRQVGALESVLAQDMARAVAWLTSIVGHLTAYAELRGERSPAASVPPKPETFETPASAPMTGEPGAGGVRAEESGSAGTSGGRPLASRVEGRPEAEGGRP